jgi:hypothetical protein
MDDKPENTEEDPDIKEILTTITRAETRLDDLKKRADLPISRPTKAIDEQSTT